MPAAALAALAAGCATPSPKAQLARPGERPSAASARVFASLSEAEVALTSIEDTRGFGAETLDESAITHCLNDGCL